jgi:hypothetical protein
LKKAVDLDEKNYEVLYMLAFALWKSGSFVESLRISEEICNIPEIKDD